MTKILNFFKRSIFPRSYPSKNRASNPPVMWSNPVFNTPTMHDNPVFDHTNECSQKNQQTIETLKNLSKKLNLVSEVNKRIIGTPSEVMGFMLSEYSSFENSDDRFGKFYQDNKKSLEAYHLIGLKKPDRDPSKPLSYDDHITSEKTLVSVIKHKAREALEKGLLSNHEAQILSDLNILPPKEIDDLQKEYQALPPINTEQSNNDSSITPPSLSSSIQKSGYSASYENSDHLNHHTLLFHNKKTTQNTDNPITKWRINNPIFDNHSISSIRSDNNSSNIAYPTKSLSSGSIRSEP